MALRLGLTSFGGPVAHLGYFRREYVTRRGWLDETAFGDVVALAQMLPGPASSQVGIAIGTRRAGMLGGVAAWLGFTLPSAVALTIFGLLAATTDLSGAGWVHGLKLAAVAVVAQAVWSMAGSLTPDWPRRIVALAAAAVALAWATPFSQVAIIAAGALIGRLLLAPPAARRDQRRAQSDLAPDGPARAGRVRRAAAGPPARCAAPEAARGAVRRVLPVRRPGVRRRPRRPAAAPRDGRRAGLGRATASSWPATAPPRPCPDRCSRSPRSSAPSPGPTPNGVPGAAIATVAIFLPSFLLIFGALPFWDRLRASVDVRRALTGTNAAVVGILLAALVTPIWTSAITGPADIAVAAAALALLLTDRVPPVAVVGAVRARRPGARDRVTTGCRPW